MDQDHHLAACDSAHFNVTCSERLRVDWQEADGRLGGIRWNLTRSLKP